MFDGLVAWFGAGGAFVVSAAAKRRVRPSKVSLTARVDPVVKAAAVRAGAALGTNLSRETELALRKHLGLEGVGQAASAGADSSATANGLVSPAASPVELGSWLAERLGWPRALCVARVRGGRVQVDGVVWTEELAPARLVEQGVLLDGERV